MVERRRLPPPAARTVYAPTADGRAAGSVLQALARFGASRLGPPEGRVRPAMAVFGLLAPYHHPDGAPLHARLVIDGETFAFVSDGRRLMTQARPDAEPDVTVEATAASVVAARRGERPLERTAVRGPAGQRARFVRAFDLELR